MNRNQTPNADFDLDAVKGHHADPKAAVVWAAFCAKAGQP